MAPPDAGAAFNLETGSNSLKFLTNCEYRFFQRPDDAVIRGYDKQAEIDLSEPGLFACNYEALTPETATEMVRDTIGIHEYTDPMRSFLEGVAASPEDDKRFFVCSSELRKLDDGTRSKNPRYLQPRPDIMNARSTYIAGIGARLRRRLKDYQPVAFPVNSVLCGRRNNPADPAAGIRALAVYNPIHYQDLPELFMDFVCSLTGKSPSTTGAGSEGALTKGPFNCLPPVVDLNNALVSFILTGHKGFTTSAGYVGTEVRVDHDISLLIPELWCRMSEEERSPDFMISERFLEKLDDFEHDGKKVYASRLGYRITHRFARYMLGRVFDTPTEIFDDGMLKPELQDMESWVDGIHNITEAQERVALGYFTDDSINAACPPLRVLLHVMAYGHYEGRSIHEPDLRAMFSREALLKSDWYAERLKTQQTRDIALWSRHVAYLTKFLAERGGAGVVEDLGLRERLAAAKAELGNVKDQGYWHSLIGTLGADPFKGLISEAANG